jgi:hypothetical protein
MANTVGEAHHQWYGSNPHDEDGGAGILFHPRSALRIDKAECAHRNDVQHIDLMCGTSDLHSFSEGNEVMCCTCCEVPYIWGASHAQCSECPSNIASQSIIGELNCTDILIYASSRVFTGSELGERSVSDKIKGMPWMSCRCLIFVDLRTDSTAAVDTCCVRFGDIQQYLRQPRHGMAVRSVVFVYHEGLADRRVEWDIN